MQILLFVATLPACFYLVYSVVFYYLPLWIFDYPRVSGHLYVLVVTDVVALFCIIFGFIYFKKQARKKNTYSMVSRVTIGKYFILLLISIILFFYLTHSVFGTFDLRVVLGDYGRFYALSKRGTAWVFLIYYSILFFICYDLYRGGLSESKIIVFMLICAILSLTGGRSFLIFIFILSLYILVILNRVQINAVKMFVFIFLLGGVFVVNTAMRAGGLQEYFLSAATQLDFNAAYILEDVLAYLDLNDPVPWMFLYDIANIFIPRAFFPDKPMSTAETHLIYPDIAEYGTNITFGIYANSLIHFGYFGYVVPFCYLIITTVIYCKIINSKRTFSNFALIVMLIYSMQFIRGGVFNYRLVMVLMTVFAGVFIFNVIRVRWRAYSSVRVGEVSISADVNL